MRNKDAMLIAFRQFAKRITGEYDKAAEALEKGDYITAHKILVALTQSHAKTSLSLRNRLVRDGFLKEDN